jgi:hypothetical protein
MSGKFFKSTWNPAVNEQEANDPYHTISGALGDMLNGIRIGGAGHQYL